MCVTEVKQWLNRNEKSPPPTTPSSTKVEPAKKSDLESHFIRIRDRLGKNPTIQEMSYYGRPVYESEIEEARKLGVIIAETPKPTGEAQSRDRLDLANGEVRTRTFVDDVSQTFTYTIPSGTKYAKIHVFGVEGSQLKEVIDSYHEGIAIDRYVVSVPLIVGTHNYTLAVRSVGGRIGVRLELG